MCVLVRRGVNCGNLNQGSKLNFSRNCSTITMAIKASNQDLTHQTHSFLRRYITTKHDKYLNPFEKLQPYISADIIPKDDHSFTPTTEEIQASEKIFTSSPSHHIQFSKAVYNLETLPLSKLPEVAFLGKSNVGKSSLIKALFKGAPDLTVRTSKTPGHTKTLNFFQAGTSFCLVDMPGYGFRMPHNYEDMVEKYLQSRSRLCRSFLLIDGQRGMVDTDQIAFDMMEQFKIPYCVVFTKIDKVSRHRLLENIVTLHDYISKNTHICLPQPFLISSTTGSGIPILQAFIAYVTGCVQIQT